METLVLWACGVPLDAIFEDYVRSAMETRLYQKESSGNWHVLPIDSRMSSRSCLNRPALHARCALSGTGLHVGGSAAHLEPVSFGRGVFGELWRGRRRAPADAGKPDGASATGCL